MVVGQRQNPEKPAMAEISRSPSLSALAAERIRAMIVTGGLRLGEALSEERLAATLGMSRTPVREALTALNLQGLITVLPQRGSFVFKPTEDDVQELCEFRALTETRALWLASLRDRDGTLTRMRAAQARMEAAHAEGDFPASAQADSDFHDAIIRGAGNQYLVQAYGLIAGQISAVRSMLLDPADVWRASAREHVEIIDSFATGDLPTAEAALVTHVMQMRPRYRVVVQTLAAAEDDEAPRRARKKTA
jgi:DNA-binding GntR family transcriptional regulator